MRTLASVRSFVVMLCLVSLVMVTNSHAAKHTISFGGEHGATYSPNNLLIRTGDVVTWVGDFAKHPLRFVSIPDRAFKPLDVTEGTSFNYEVRVAGTYHFRTDDFTGMFGVIGNTISVDSPEDVKMLSISPNPIHQDTPLTIELGFDGSLVEQVNICDLDGMCGMFIEGGGYFVNSSRVTIPNMSYGSGLYTLSISHTNGAIYRRKLIITR